RPCESRVRVPTDSAAVLAMRASVTRDVAYAVRFFALLPVKVSAVPPLSETVKERAKTASSPRSTAAVIPPEMTTLTEMVRRSITLPAFDQRREKSGDPEPSVGLIAPDWAETRYSPSDPLSA